MTEHDATLSQGSLSSLKELRRMLTGAGLECSIYGPPGGNPNA